MTSVNVGNSLQSLYQHASVFAFYPFCIFKPADVNIFQDNVFCPVLDGDHGITFKIVIRVADCGEPVDYNILVCGNDEAARCGIFI